MRLVDLRSASEPTAPRVTARASSAAELLRLIGVLVDDDRREYDVGDARIAQIREQVPPTLLDDIRSLRASEGEDMRFLVLALLAAELPDPAGVEELVALLRADPELAWRAVLAHHVKDVDAPDTPGLQRRVLRGDADAVGQVETLAEEGCCPVGAASLLTTPPDEYGRDLLDVVERFDVAVWRAHADEAMEPIRRDVEHRNQQIADGVDPAEVVLAATNGFELPDDPKIREVVLLPSYWFRPWLVVAHLDVDGLGVMSTPVADEFVALPSETPPPALLKLFKALSDEGRLALLRKLTDGPISLGQAAGELGVAKATAHHHLAILRQAGLVSLRGEGRSTRYALRGDPAAIAQEALAAYVPIRR